ncbi:hypothetical protein NK507_003998 [Salmonella enterica]|nr:hypothetical protein [Salmonella enterica]
MDVLGTEFAKWWQSDPMHVARCQWLTTDAVSAILSGYTETSYSIPMPRIRTDTSRFCLT